MRTSSERTWRFHSRFSQREVAEQSPGRFKEEALHWAALLFKTGRRRRTASFPIAFFLFFSYLLKSFRFCFYSLGDQPKFNTTAVQSHSPLATCGKQRVGAARSPLDSLSSQAAKYRARGHGGALQTGQQQHGRHDCGRDDHEGQPSDR